MAEYVFGMIAFSGIVRYIVEMVRASQDDGKRCQDDGDYRYY